MAKVEVTVTSSTEQAYNLAVLGARTLKSSRDVFSDQRMTLRAQVMVKVTMTFKTASLVAMLCIKAHLHVYLQNTTAKNSELSKRLEDSQLGQDKLR